MEKNNLKYFLAANSCEGFVSEFNNCYDPHNGWKAYIIKGGPGTGKSSFMKYTVVKAGEKNIKYELYPCSSDPNSLDAVIFPELKLAIMDGTAPHTVDPVYPAVCEKILNFGEFWNEKAFAGFESEIIRLTDKNKAHHKTASHYLQAAGQLLADSYKTALSCTDKNKAISYADNFCRRFIPKKSSKAKEHIRFIQGITPLGVVSYSGTVLNTAENVFIIDDEYGAAADIIVSRVRQTALENGYEIITLKNPFLPSLLCDHIIIPELSLAVVTENSYIHFASDTRRIHARRFTANKQLHRSKERLKFNKKVIKQLLISAAVALDEAKSVHDELEDYYIKAMDFVRLTEFANDFCKKLF